MHSDPDQSSIIKSGLGRSKKENLFLTPDQCHDFYSTSTSKSHIAFHTIAVLNDNQQIHSHQVQKRNNWLQAILTFFLYALLGTSIVLGETTQKRNLNEFKFMLSLFSFMILASIFYYMFKKTCRETENHWTDKQGDYIKLVLFASVGFVLSYSITQTMNTTPLFSQKISTNTAQWLCKTFHVNVI